LHTFNKLISVNNLPRSKKKKIKVQIFKIKMKKSYAVLRTIYQSRGPHRPNHKFLIEKHCIVIHRTVSPRILLFQNELLIFLQKLPSVTTQKTHSDPQRCLKNCAVNASIVFSIVKFLFFSSKNVKS